VAWQTMNRESVSIREMSPEDVPEAAKIEKMSFSTPWSETSFHAEVHNIHSIARVAELENAIAGYICIRQVNDECHLLDLAVHPDHRDKGIATALFNNIMEDLKPGKCRTFFLEVRTSNEAARKMYEKFGFNIVGIRKKYYINPTDDAVIMMMEL